MAHLEIHALNKRFGAFVALEEVELTADKGEFVVLLGPSGCGKTTLLRTLAGLERQDGGRIVHAGRDISTLPAAQRDYGIVFQSYALFPNLTVAGNISYGLHKLRRPSQWVKQRVEETLTLVGLPGTEGKYPSQLSGGQQQRIALARALATVPDLLLLDEPLSALDAIERVRLRGEIRNLQKRLGVTTIMVTHDQEEALAMADRIIVMKNGRIQQTGTPEDIYRQPANSFVADFIGRTNALKAVVDSRGWANFGDVRLQPGFVPPPPGPHCFYIRPEDIRLCGPHDPSENSFSARVLQTEFLGASSLFTLQLANSPEHVLQAQFSSNYLNGRNIRPGTMLRLAIPPEQMTCLSGNS